MQLYIDTTDGKTITLALAAGGEVVAQKCVAARHQQSETLLKEIARLLRTAGKTKRSLRGIAVVSGPGKFTATRIGVTTANALAYALDIPVAGVARGQYSTVQEWAAVGGRSFGGKKHFSNKRAVEPVYDGEPSISMPKK